MKSREWNRSEVVGHLGEEIWRYITQSSTREEDLLLSAAALLQMTTSEVRLLAQLQFILSEPVGRLLAEMHSLVRRLSNTTVTEAEVSAERLRGAVNWGQTYTHRAARGQRNMYVTSPARRAFNTPENEVLVFALHTIVEFGKRTGWHRSKIVGPALEIQRRVVQAERWLQSVGLGGLRPYPPTDLTLSRVRSGRNYRRYASALEVLQLYERFIVRLDRDAVRAAIERGALITRSDDVLLELLCAFETIAALRNLGWVDATKQLVGPAVGRPLLFAASRKELELRVYYQCVPRELSLDSRYRRIQHAHNFPHSGPLRPDFVISVTGWDRVRWLLIEVKGGRRRDVLGSARQAAFDLMAYRRTYSTVLDRQSEPYGLGYAWGSGLQPSTDSDVTLCTPDTLPNALQMLFDEHW